MRGSPVPTTGQITHHLLQVADRHCQLVPLLRLLLGPLLRLLVHVCLEPRKRIAYPRHRCICLAII